MEQTTPVPSAAPEGPVARLSPIAWPMAKWLRLVLVLSGLLLWSLLLVARMLQPDGSGYGTHRQLGLPPCSAQQMFGIRCPACGMTTSWAYLTRGMVWQSLRVNSGGTLLGLAVFVLGPWLLMSGVLGRWWGGL